MVLFGLCPLIQANCGDAAAVVLMVALLNLGDLQHSKLSIAADSDPGEHVGLVAVRQRFG